MMREMHTPSAACRELVEANIRPNNEASIALVRGLGFRHEGTSQRFIRIAGEWADHERFAMTVEEVAGWRSQPVRSFPAGNSGPVGEG